MKTYCLYYGKYDSAVFELENLPKCSWDIGRRRIYTFDAKDWNDAMRQYHEFMGWEPYIPFEQRHVRMVPGWTEAWD